MQQFIELAVEKEISWNLMKYFTQFDGVSPVHSHFYLLSSDLYRIEGKHADFYR